MLNKQLQFYIKIGEQYQLLKGLKTVNYTLLNDLYRDTTISENNWQNFVNFVAKQSLEITLEGVLLIDDAESLIKKAAILIEKLDCKIIFSDDEVIYGKFLVKIYQRLAASKTEESYKILFVSAGELRKSCN
jgi:predicted secreted protein